MRILFAHEPRVYRLLTQEVGLDPDVPLQNVELPKGEDEEKAEKEDTEEEGAKEARNLRSSIAACVEQSPEGSVSS